MRPIIDADYHRRRVREGVFPRYYAIQRAEVDLARQDYVGECVSVWCVLDAEVIVRPGYPTPERGFVNFHVQFVQLLEQEVFPRSLSSGVLIRLEISE